MRLCFGVFGRGFRGLARADCARKSYEVQAQMNHRWAV